MTETSNLQISFPTNLVFTNCTNYITLFLKTYYLFIAPDNLKIPHELKSQYFKFTAKVLNSHLTKAHLWIYVKPSAMHPKTDGIISGRIIIYQIVRARIGDRPTLMTNREKKIEVNVKKGSWVKVEVKKLLTHWIRYPNENLGI
ncbi:myostatin-like protein, partial [Leptotrombidium deliense]